MARPKIDDSEARARIAAAAEELFADRGYGETAIRDIARKAGVNAAMIHYYFGSKEGLYKSILEGAASKVRALLVQTVSGPASTKERLAQFVDSYAAYILSHPNLARILYREMLTGGEHLMRIAQQYAVTNYTILKDTIFEGIRTGELRPIDYELAPISLMGMVVIFQFLRPIISAALVTTKYDERFVNRIASHTIDLFFNGAGSSGGRSKEPATSPGRKKPGAKRGAKVR
ncbi:MAG TPA: CerR family C-terminal domain-containing protein [Blastocatellia bacterium]|nr:CerR family C-terminal domain-containing protein [Blastocatellia bacterium]